MAITTEAANRVRQKTLAFSRNAGIFYQVKAFFLHLAANKLNPDLQYVNIDGTSTASDGGNADQVVANAACNLFMVYLKQAKASATATWFQLADSASATAKNGTDDITIAFKNATVVSERLYDDPVGQTMSNGITLSETTTATGGTRTLKANRIDGFVILSAGLGN